MSQRPLNVEAVVRDVVRQVVERTLGQPAADGSASARVIIDETAVRQMPAHSRQPIPAKAF